MNTIDRRDNATLILLDTSNEAGDTLCGNGVWLRQTMATVRASVPVFLFMYIPFIHNAQATDICQGILGVLTDFPASRLPNHILR